MKKYLFLIFLTIAIAVNVFSQQSAVPSYVKGYFRYPLDIPARLNANFGEMRPNHFHMGLDLFTLRKENLNIYAAAAGYVSRVKIEPGGFGNAIYLAHPNGTTTLYAHMNSFFPALEQYVKQEQYKSESWEQDLEVPAGLFPVKKGDIIGKSGNTGGSQGPHVHFEIRETATEKCMNPLLWGFNIPDNVPPDIHKIVLYNREKSIYEQPPLVVTAVRTATGSYRATVPKLSWSKMVMAVHATDRMTAVPNNNGIYETTLYEGDNPVAGFKLDRIGYDETRYLNAHIDYRTRTSGGSYVQFLMPLPGDRLDVYPYSERGQFIELADTAVHEYRLEVRDPYGNTSSLQFALQRSPVNQLNPVQPNLMRPDEVNVFENENLEVYIPENTLYDSIYFKYSTSPGGQPETYSAVHLIHSGYVPLHSNFTVRIKPDKTIPYDLRDRVLVKKTTRSSVMVKKASWVMGKYSAEFRDFGSFQLIADRQAPVIGGLVNGANLSKYSRIVLQVSDNNRQIRNFRAELDGKWLRFVQRGNSFRYVFDEKCRPGKHQLKISVEDEAGNIATREFTFIR